MVTTYKGANIFSDQIKCDYLNTDIFLQLTILNTGSTFSAVWKNGIPQEDTESGGKYKFKGYFKMLRCYLLKEISNYKTLYIIKEIM